ncbi:MAG TPA: glucokinase [Burkholderiales bacterium]|nr:glucokinase [Burkholderiales bacterium]
MRVLAGDVGGTKTLLCIAEVDDGATRILRQQRLENAAFREFGEVLKTFLGADADTDIAGACFGIAGPVRDTPHGQHVKVTNLPWEVDSAALARDFGFPRIGLVNDFVAIGHAVETLQEKEFVALNRGIPDVNGPRGVIGAGTGLGQAILIKRKGHYDVIATEGSKADFGPTNELQLDLARYLMQRHGRASYELVLSGSGLVRLYEFLLERGEAPESREVAEAMKREDPAAVITQAGTDGRDALATATLDLFIAIYGAQTGNLALTIGATGGMYVAGGIAPKLISRLTDGNFMRAFSNRAKMSDYVNAIPVWVVMNPEIGLLGAVSVASRLD